VLDEEDAPPEELTGVVGATEGEVVGAVVELLLGCGDEAVALAPGCSLATTTPMTTVAPVAATTTALLNRRTRVWARSRPAGDSGERPRYRSEALPLGFPALPCGVFVIST